MLPVRTESRAGYRPDDAAVKIVRVQSDGTETDLSSKNFIQDLEVTKRDDSAEYSFYVPGYDSSGNKLNANDKYSYKLVQTGSLPDVYTTETTTNASEWGASCTFNNKLDTKRLTSFTANVKWDNDTGKEDLRPQSLLLTLYQTVDGRAIIGFYIVLHNWE
jgi:hypothetical protein